LTYEKSIKPDLCKNARVLVVDDNPANLEVMESYLRACGFTVLVATSGNIVLKRISYIRPDIILLDVMMPGIDGFETCLGLKSNKETRDIPVIFMTALIDPEHKVKGFSVGGVDYITKPVEKEELLARVSTHLEISRYRLHLEKEIKKRTMELEERMFELENEIFERKKAEEDLKKARNHIANIIDSMPSMIMGVDAHGRVTECNKTAEKVMGTTAVAAHGKKLSDLLPQMTLKMEKIAESIRTREIKQVLKKPRITGNGTIYEDITIYPLIDSGVDCAVIRIDDVTHKVKMEEIIVQSEKMLSVGGLAAGMAHEINNPLAGMIQTADVISRRLGKIIDMPANLKAAKEAGTTMEAIKIFMESRGIPPMLMTITESGHRLASIVENMLSFARKSDFQASFHSLEKLFEKTLELAATDYNLKKQYDFKMIGIRREYEKDLPEVPCDGVKIQQVLLNILRNGAQAMQGAGTREPVFIVRTRFEKSRNMVSMEIEDNGPGMVEINSKRVFEPFYTTKPVGLGTGLGLSVSYFIITENHGGEMCVESTPGRGARFIIRLPVEKIG